MLRRLPQVGEVLRRPDVAALAHSLGHRVVREAVRRGIERRRRAVLDSADEAAAGVPLDAPEVAREAAALGRATLRPVLNATGVVLHTNLGRAPLCAEAVAALAATAGRYLPVEYDLDAGERGSRHRVVEPLLKDLTGAEAAAVVNNNAAAVLLALSALASGRECVVSRGELVEIGGSFRIPDVMAASGAVLREVGTTNRTHLRDYAGAMGPATAALMKVHRSNFRIEGFQAEVGLRELAELARPRGVPVLYDCGSGSFTDMAFFGITGEMTVRAALTEGADLVTCSGDKLLGGPQAGIVAGRADLVERCRKHPLMRALRPGRLTLAALEATLRVYRDADDPAAHIPALGMLAATPAALEARARALAARLAPPLAAAGVVVTAAPDEGAVGGGAAAAQALPTWTVTLRGGADGPDETARRLRLGDPPVVARIRDNATLLDLRTLLPDEDAALGDAVIAAFGGRQEVAVPC
jgi:L-seryl-tRNA(Ser) seleniumtransferase